MRRVLRKGRTGSALGVGAAVTALIAGSTLLSPGSSTKTAAPSPAEARAALTRLLHQDTLGPGVRVPGTLRRTPAAAVRVDGVTQQSFYNWSGFAVTQSSSATYTKVAGAWTEPTVNCVPNEDTMEVFWVGLDGLNDGTVEQDGTMAQCIAGVAYHYTWWEMYPTNNIVVVGGTVKAGDQIQASVNFSSGQYTLALNDSTRAGDSFIRTETCTSGCANSSAEWIAETPGTTRGDAPWAPFGTWKVTSATAGTSAGATGVINSFPDTKITIINNNGIPLAATGVLNPTGNGFNLDWKYIW